jgi:hypothetical protein
VIVDGLLGDGGLVWGSWVSEMGSYNIPYCSGSEGWFG